MSIHVVKFGGSNLRTYADILRIINIIKDYEAQLCIVVSAFYGLTNRLEKACEIAPDSKGIAISFCRELLKENTEMLDLLVHDESLKARALAYISTAIQKLEENLLQINKEKTLSDELYCEILAVGEKLSANLLHYSLLDSEVENQLCLPEVIGFYTNSNFKNAEVDLEESQEGVKHYIRKSSVNIVPGFYGINSKKQITLLGRSGSDYSAAVLANLLDADFLDVWKDVNGFCTTDPSLVPDAKNISELNYTEVAELAYFGAEILHPASIAPVEIKNIPIRIFDIRKDSKNPQTLISERKNYEYQVIKSISFKNDFAILKLKGSSVGFKPGILANVCSALNNADINISSVITSQIAINLLLSAKDLKRSERIISDLNLKAINEIQAHENLCLIAAVGHGIIDRAGIAQRIFSATSKIGVNVKMCALGASVVSAYIIVNNEDSHSSLKAIHEELFDYNQISTN